VYATWQVLWRHDNMGKMGSHLLSSLIRYVILRGGGGALQNVRRPLLGARPVAALPPPQSRGCTLRVQDPIPLGTTETGQR